MLFITLIFISHAKRTIYICNEQCHPCFPTDSFVVMSSDSNFIYYILPQIIDEKETELLFFSKSDGYQFEIDMSYFNYSTVTLKTYFESKPIKINFKNESQLFFKTVELKPDYQISLPNLIPYKQDTIHNQKKKLWMNQLKRQFLYRLVYIKWK